MAVRVSILVLVEVLPWGKQIKDVRIVIDSFNPCSGGSIALGQEGGDDMTPEAKVSILVLVEVLPWAQRKTARPW